MKILLINYEYPPLGGGGSTASLNIAKAFVSLGHDVAVITSYYKGLPKYESDGKLEVYRMPSYRKHLGESNPLQMLCFIFSAIIRISLVKKIKPDVTLAFFSIPSGIVALWFKWLFKIDYVVSLRGGDVPGFLPQQLKYWHLLSNPINKIVWKNAKAVNANNPVLQKLAQTFLPIKIKVIPNGVDAESFFPAIKKERTQSIKAIFVGRLTFQKNLEILAEAVRKSTNNIKLTIVGDGPQLNKLQKAYQDIDVEFKGWISREELADIYRSNDVFILPSHAEGMSNSLIEAMACGLPAIVSSDYEHQLIQDNVNGYIFKSDNVTELKKILNNLNMKEIYRLGKNARNTALKYNWVETARNFIKQLK